MQQSCIRPFITTYLLVVLFQLCIHTPAAVAAQRRKQRANVPSSFPRFPPLFSTNISPSVNSSGLPPKLQTRIYIPQHRTPANLTHRQIMGERRIIDCQTPHTKFHHSHCRRKDELTGSIRKYVAWCREYLPPNAPRPTFTLPSEARAMASSIAQDDFGLRREDASLRGEYGICDVDEVCVDSLYSVEWRAGMVLIANCVKKDHFRDADIWNDEWDDEDDAEKAEYWDEERAEWEEAQQAGKVLSSGDLYALGDEQYDGKNPNHSVQKPGGGSNKQTESQNLPVGLFAGRYASVIVTEDEQADTPLHVERMQLRSLENDTAYNEHGYRLSGVNQTSSDDLNDNQNLVRPGITGQERACTNCMGLKTFKPFSPNTEGLELEVKLATLGSAAVTGVLWLALLSG